MRNTCSTHYRLRTPADRRRSQRRRIRILRPTLAEGEPADRLSRTTKRTSAERQKEMKPGLTFGCSSHKRKDPRRKRHEIWDANRVTDSGMVSSVPHRKVPRIAPQRANFGDEYGRERITIQAMKIN